MVSRDEALRALNNVLVGPGNDDCPQLVEALPRNSSGKVDSGRLG